MLACLVLRRELLRVTVEVEALCVTLDSMSLVLVSVIDVLIEVIGGEIVVNNTAGTSGFFASLWAIRDSSEEAMESNLLA